MAILRGTSQSRFPPFDDPNTGAGFLIERGQKAVLSFLKGVDDGQFESKFVEDGVQNIPGSSTIDRSFSQIQQPSRRQMLTQAPQATVFVKKKMFSALRSNYDVRFLGQKEKIFLRASKLLFERKAQTLSFYESLVRIEDVFDSSGFLSIDKSSDKVLGSLFQLLELSFDGLSVLGGRQFSLSEIVGQSSILSPFAKMTDELLKLQDVNRRSKGNQLTKWITDPSNPDVTGVGAGVGVIELNLVSNFNTNVSKDSGGGGANFTIEDPYKISVITDSDIEIALGEAIAQQNIKRGSVRTIGNDLLFKAEALDNQLNELRRKNGKSSINFEFELESGKAIGTIIETSQSFGLYSIGLVNGKHELSSLEAAMAKEIMVFMEGFHLTDQNNIDLFQILNDQYNDVRQKLRNEFVGHSIIQQMDVVHVFINGKTRDVTPGSEQNVDNGILLGNLQIQGDMLDVSAIKTEWEQTAPALPFEFYLALRDRTQWRSDGSQIFCGPVDSVGTEYNADDGSFSINVSCKDNVEFLRIGRFNKSPSLAQPDGLINDPLTPFNLNVDSATGLISSEPKLSDENIRRLPYLRFDDGIMAGKKVTEDNVIQDKKIGGQVVSFQHAPGLTYKWKDGIISETLNVSTKKPLNGKGSTIADVVETYGVSTFENPFAGLDAADVVSILVTGRPHNYATFLRHSLDIGTYTIDNTNQNKFYFNYLFDFFERQSTILGNFVPSKSSIVSPSVAASAFREKSKMDGLNGERIKLEKQIADIEDQLKGRSTSGNAIIDSNLLNLKVKRGKLEAALTEAINGAKEGFNSDGADAAAASLSVVGNDLLLSFDDVEIEDKNRTLKYQVRKKPEDVRYNLDKNFLVVSEQYDSDLDIQAFARELKSGKPDLFKSTYQSPLDLCSTAAQTVGFELFADSQGNIVFRPPEYNKTPLSLLLKLISLKSTEGVGYVPEFIHSLFKSRSELIEDQILLTELQILENILLLGQPLESTIDGRGVNDLTLSIDTADGGVTWALDVDLLQSQLKKSSLFEFTEQKKLRNKSQEFNPSEFAVSLINVRNNINQLLGRTDKIKRTNDLTSIDNARKEIARSNVSTSTVASITRLNIVNEIAQLVSKRQLVGRAYLKIIENARDFNLLEGQTGGHSQSDELFIPSSVSAQLRGVNRDIPAFPKYMESLIENDLTNEEGFRSGKRFIIMDDVILRMSLRVNTPEFNQIEVVGNQDFLSGRDGSLGGVAKVLWAGSTDFDSWRQFGYRAGQPIFRPDFTNPESQCAPYAIFKLQEERRKIHQGTVTLVGNEFYQVGDVVYLNNRSMLYYVTKVSHNFVFSSGSFTTTLTLEYGRALGEYIPTTLDIIGKGLLANQRRAFGNIAVNRASVSTNHSVFLETLFLPEYSNVSYFNMGDIKSEFIKRPQNLNKVQNAIQKASGRINKKKQGEVKIEVRTYYVDGLNDSFQKAKDIGSWVQDMLSGQITEQTSGNLSESRFKKSDVILIPPINISSTSELSEREEKLRRFPSAQAWSGLTSFVDGDGVGLPLNAIDIFFVAEKSRYGDQDPIKLQETGNSS